MKKAVIINDTSYENHFGCEKVMDNIRQLLIQNGIEVIATNPVGVKWDRPELLDDVLRSDLVIVNGEGTLHHSQQRARLLIPIAKYIKEKIKDIPVILINSTYDSNDSSFIEYVAYFDLIFVRESLSQKELLSFGISSEVVPDMTFYNRRPKHDIITRGVGVTDSVFIELSKKLYSLSKTEKILFLPIFKKNSEHINILNRVKQRLKKIKYFLYKESNSLYSIDRNNFCKTDYNEYISTIESLELLISARYHSLCFAIQCKTPFFALCSNSHKIEGMLKDMDMESRLLKDFDYLKRVGFVDIDKSFSEDEEKKIKLFLSNAIIKIENMFKQISNTVI